MTNLLNSFRQDYKQNFDAFDLNSVFFELVVYCKCESDISRVFHKDHLHRCDEYNIICECGSKYFVRFLKYNFDEYFQNTSLYIPSEHRSAIKILEM